MSIPRIPSKKKTKDLEGFINNAPDAALHEAAKSTRKRRGKREQISVTFTPEMMEKIEEKARTLGVSHSALVNLCVSKAMDQF